MSVFFCKSPDHSYSKWVPEVIGCIQAKGAHRVTKYAAPDFVVKATRAHESTRRVNARNVTLLVTFGQPNYAEREFIKKALAAGEPFPVKRVQIKYYPTKPLKRASRAVAAARKAQAGKKLTTREIKSLAAANLGR